MVASMAGFGLTIEVLFSPFARIGLGETKLGSNEDYSLPTMMKSKVDMLRNGLVRAVRMSDRGESTKDKRTSNNEQV